MEGVDGIGVVMKIEERITCQAGDVRKDGEQDQLTLRAYINRDQNNP